MADKKISQLTAASTPLAGTEVLPIVQGGSTVKVSVADLTAGRAVNAQSITTSSTIGVGVTASAWTLPSVQTQYGLFAGQSESNYTTNAYFSGGWKYIATGAATQYRQYLGQHIFSNAVSGSADGAISFSTVFASDTNSNLVVNTGNLVIGTAGKGIDFSANTHAAGMTSELLNWYEEGTWTAGVSFGGGSTGVTYANNAGYYTRVGNIVTVSCYLVLSNKGSSTGAARITGLPFTCVNNAAGYSALSVLPLNVTVTGQLSGYANVNATTIDLVPSTGVALTDVGFANNSTFIISLTYRAA